MMATAESLTRRSHAVRALSETKHGSSSLVESVQCREKELTSPSNGSSASFGRHEQRRGRRKDTKVEFLMRVVQRRYMFHARRNPWLAQNIRMIAALTFGIGLVGMLKAAMILHQRLDNGTSKLASRPKKIGTVAAPKISVNIDIVFSEYSTSSTRILQPEELDSHDEEERFYSDYGGLKIHFFEESRAVRNILHDHYFLETNWRDHNMEPDDDSDTYYAFDDDHLRSQAFADTSDDEAINEVGCRRVSEHRLNFQNCNTVYELPLLEHNVKYLNEGTYRQVMVLDHKSRDGSEKIVIKELHYDYDAGYDHYEYVRMDAVVAERLTASPRIFDIYGMCGLSILSEFFPHGDMDDIAFLGEGYMEPEDLEDEDEVKPQNNLTPIEKLTIALDMAESIAELHGHPGGVIVHGDIHTGQFLYNLDKSLTILNDFNRAEWMTWDDKKKDYCRHTNGGGHGTWRAPEEFEDHLLNEKIDVWSLGNNMYALLTGLCPFYEDMGDTDLTQERIMEGETAFIDPRYRARSVAERRLIEVMERCFVFEPDARADVFEVVEKLREGLQEALQEEENQKVRQDARGRKSSHIRNTLRAASPAADDKVP